MADLQAVIDLCLLTKSKSEVKRQAILANPPVLALAIESTEDSGLLAAQAWLQVTAKLAQQAECSLLRNCLS